MSAPEELEIRPDVDDLAIAPEPEELRITFDETVPAPEAVGATLSRGLVEILPVGTPLPALAKFIPNPALKIAVREAMQDALAVAVDGGGAVGIEKADVALSTLRANLKAVEAHLEEPIGILNAMHKGLTSIRREWMADGEDAAKLVGQRIYAEGKRLERVANDERRRQQDEADAAARQQARQAAEEAARHAAPPEVVEQLTQQAATATAAPVPSAPLPTTTHSTPIETWKARLVDTPAGSEPNPQTAALADTQRRALFALLRAILDGHAPVTLIQVDWAAANKRATADKTAFNIPGLEAFTEGGMRQKGGRRR